MAKTLPFCCYLLDSPPDCSCHGCNAVPGVGSANFHGADMSSSVDNNVDSVDALAGGPVDLAWLVVLASESGFYPVFWGSI